MRTVISLALCCLLLSAASARAESGIVLFNVQKVASECAALQEAKSSLEKKYGAQRDALEKQRETLENKAAALKGKATDKQRADLNKMHQEYTEKAQAFMRNFQAEEARVRKDIDNAITTAAKELAAKNGYRAILDAAAAVYADPSLDVTDAMLVQTDEAWKKIKLAPANAKENADDKGNVDGKGNANSKGNADGKTPAAGK